MRSNANESPVDCKLEYEADDEVKEHIRNLGRTEDVHFSPTGRRLAMVCFSLEQIAVFDVCVQSCAGELKPVISDYYFIVSPSLKITHGVFFLDEDTLMVASRGGCVDLFKLPKKNPSRKTIELLPVFSIKGGIFSRLNSPGSICATQTRANLRDVLVCNNFKHVVTKHTLEVANNGEYRVHNRGVFARNTLNIPDGLHISANDRWVAVSNHHGECVAIYPNASTTNRRTPPVGICHGVVCPHGLRFVDNDRYLIVASASTPFVQIYESKDGDWSGDRHPFRTVRVLDDETYLRGRYNPEEGGIKGIDIDPTKRVLATTCAMQVLAFFDYQKMVQGESTMRNAA